MRQLTLKLDKGHVDEVLSTVKQFKGKNTMNWAGEEHDIFMVFLPNEKLNDFLKEIDKISKPEVSFIPRGVITLYPPASKSPDQAADVQPKSSLEIFLSGIQSVGSIKGLIGYSLAAGLIVWIGLYTTTIYLLVAAMLVAPFAGPAMNAALATAAGDRSLLRRSINRYAISIGTGVLASFLMTVLFPLETLTPLMIELSQVSKVALFLPLIAGFAGAINICQSERDSLVSGAAVGILVAASLAPPVGLIGAGAYLMDWEIVGSSIFRIILQLLGIHLSATLVFHFFGKVSPRGVRFLKGSRKLAIATSVVVVFGIGIMMFWQFSGGPFLQKSSMNTELSEKLSSVLKEISFVRVIDKQVEFTSTEVDGKPVVNFQVTLLPKDTIISGEILRKLMTQYLKENLNPEADNLYKVYQIEVVTD